MHKADQKTTKIAKLKQTKKCNTNFVITQPKKTVATQKKSTAHRNGAGAYTFFSARTACAVTHTHKYAKTNVEKHNQPFMNMSSLELGLRPCQACKIYFLNVTEIKNKNGAAKKAA